MFASDGRKSRVAILCLLAMPLVAALAVTASPAQGEEKYFARAVSMGSIGHGKSTTLQIRITRWTTDEERIGLLGVVTQYANKKRGQEELVKALQAEKETGWIQIFSAGAMSSGFPSTRLHYSRAFPGEDGGRTIVLVTDRPIGFGEAVWNPGTIDYPISVIILNVDKDGKGDGSLAIGVHVGFDEKTGKIEIAQYSTEPIRLTKVELKGSSS